MARKRKPPTSPADRPPGFVLDRQKYTQRFRATLPSNWPSLNQAVHSVLDLADELGCVEDHKADLEIALREALANAIIHGNKKHEHKRVLLRCYAAPAGHLLIAVRDEGEGFDPHEVPDPRSAERIYLHHGRGIFLMRELMDHVEHRKGGREVLLYRTFDTDPPKPNKK